MTIDNPFVIRNYEGKNLFCDREDDLHALVNNVKGRVDTTLISHRRMGKTGLIMRLFEELHDSGSDIKTIYVDIYASRNLSDFIRLVAEAVMREYPSTSSFGEKFLEFIKAFRPKLSFDAITGSPEISIDYHNEVEKERTLRSILEFLERQDNRVLLAIDEFQQIREYPETNTEAILRTYIQQLRNVNFIFCGSKKHMMIDMFSNANSPFYASTRYLHLNPIPEKPYREFIHRLFKDYGREISEEAIDFILQWTRRHTFYTQSLCHSVFATGSREVNVRDVEKACGEILATNEAVYLQYRQLLTPAQWNYLIAIAKEHEVEQVTAGAFLKRYNIGSASSSQRLLQSLLDKEMLIENVGRDKTTYTVYDVFLMRWMENFER